MAQYLTILLYARKATINSLYFLPFYSFNATCFSLSSDPWWGNEINNTKMENLLFLLAGLMMLNFFVFCVVAHYYSYQDPSKFEEIVQEEAEAGEKKIGDERSNGSPSHGNDLGRDNHVFHHGADEMETKVDL